MFNQKPSLQAVTSEALLDQLESEGTLRWNLKPGETVEIMIDLKTLQAKGADFRSFSNWLRARTKVAIENGIIEAAEIGELDSVVSVKLKGAQRPKLTASEVVKEKAVPEEQPVDPKDWSGNIIPAVKVYKSKKPAVVIEHGRRQ